VATAQASDADMARRIQRHRRERGEDWLTVEEPVELARALSALVGRAEAVVVDCVTVWVGNRQLRGDSDETILDEARALGRLAGDRAFRLVIVSNEVGEGVHPETELGCRFRDLLGGVNQCLAAACDRVVLMVAGLPLMVKDRQPAPSLHARLPQAP
jgi:adenosylcobinamide kinase/adenosylcobinamide-phosphate guanylyltransferase